MQLKRVRPSTKTLRSALAYVRDADNVWWARTVLRWRCSNLRIADFCSIHHISPARFNREGTRVFRAWQSIVEKCEQSGSVAIEFCSRNRISIHDFRSWRAFVWEGRVKCHARSGLSVKQFCDRENLLFFEFLLRRDEVRELIRFRRMSSKIVRLVLRVDSFLTSSPNNGLPDYLQSTYVKEWEKVVDEWKATEQDMRTFCVGKEYSERQLGLRWIALLEAWNAQVRRLDRVPFGPEYDKLGVTEKTRYGKWRQYCQIDRINRYEASQLSQKEFCDIEQISLPVFRHHIAVANKLRSRRGSSYTIRKQKNFRLAFAEATKDATMLAGLAFLAVVFYVGYAIAMLVPLALVVGLIAAPVGLPEPYNFGVVIAAFAVIAMILGPSDGVDRTEYEKGSFTPCSDPPREYEPPNREHVYDA